MPETRKGNQKAVAALAVLLAICLAGAVWLARRNSERAEALARLERENVELRRKAAGQETVPPAHPESAAALPHVQTRGMDQRAPAASTAAVEQARMLVELQAKLAAANTTIAEMEARLVSLESNLQKVSAEHERLAGSESELREKLAATSRVAEALQEELKSRNDRLAQLELANRSLRETSASVSGKLTRLSQASREIEEINRRRETYLNNLLRRYRDLTDLYRTASLRLNDPGENGARIPPGELSRIESVVTMAEDDLKQLTTLNAQASRVLAKAK